MKIYLTRHGETEWNIESRLQGTYDSRLTEKGVQDIKKLSKRLIDIEIDTIYSSTSQRAIDTAHILQGQRKIEIVKSPRLKEMNVGDWQGQVWEKIKDENPREYAQYWNTPHLYTSNQGGEDFYQVQHRAISLINTLVEIHKGQTILLVSHGVILKTIFTYFQKKSMKQLWKQPVLAGGSLSKMEILDNELTISFLGDTTHL